MNYSEFRDSTLFEKAIPMVINAPWASYRVELEECGLVLQFKNNKLLSVGIGFNLPDENLSESEMIWSRENEMKRKQLHDDILKAELGSVYRKFAWGEVGSIADPKTYDASIFVNYL